MRSQSIGEAFIAKSRALLTADYLPKIERSVQVLSDEQIWWRANEASNSIGNLVLHLCGNVTMWIIGGVGQQPFERDRQQEFDRRSPIGGGELIDQLRLVVSTADAIFGGVDDAMLLSPRQIQGYDVTVLDAMYHVVEHF